MALRGARAKRCCSALLSFKLCSTLCSTYDNRNLKIIDFTGFLLIKKSSIPITCFRYERSQKGNKQVIASLLAYDFFYFLFDCATALHETEAKHLWVRAPLETKARRDLEPMGSVSPVGSTFHFGPRKADVHWTSCAGRLAINGPPDRARPITCLRKIGIKVIRVYRGNIYNLSVVCQIKYEIYYDSERGKLTEMWGRKTRNLRQLLYRGITISIPE